MTLKILDEIITETEVRLARRKVLFSQIEKENPIGERALMCAELIYTDKELLKRLKKNRKKIIKSLTETTGERDDGEVQQREVFWE